MPIEFKEKVENLFKNSEKFSDSDGVLFIPQILEAIEKIDGDLIKILISDAGVKNHFFTQIEDVYVLDQNKLIEFFMMNDYMKNGSYTSYTNKIGLIKKDSFIKKFDDVVLVWPHKDCVLEGGQTKDDDKSKETFYNEILSHDEIDRLFEPKALTNIKRYSVIANEVKQSTPTDINENDNLIIKGNNLIALHSLKKKFAGKVKLIYIDPPYNPTSDNNTFSYNNNFNHSSWLTFMKNRLEVAKEFLRDDSAMIIAIDKHEVNYLGVLIDEIFNGYENHCITIVHNPRGTIGANFSYTHEYAYFIFPKGKKIIGNRKIEEENIDYSNLRNWGSESERKDAKNCFYPIIIDKCTNQVIDFGDVCEDDFHPPINVHKGDFVEIYPIDKEYTERKWRYARQSIEEIKDLLRVKENKGIYDIQIGKDFGTYRTVWVDKRYDANEYGTKIVNDLVPNNNFSFPKSLWNVYDCLYSVVGNDKEALIMDFHAGSGTTAHAVLELNKNDGGNRRFILIEQMDYIETVTTERVKKVIEKNGESSFVYAELKTIDTFKDAEIGVLNKNMQYLHIGEIEDENYGVSAEEIAINKAFYGLG
ncbi:MAG: site-specific DNA-methyltransferase [Sulfurovaceae bacterium]